MTTTLFVSSQLQYERPIMSGEGVVINVHSVTMKAEYVLVVVQMRR